MAMKPRPGKEAIEAKGWLKANKWLLLRRLSQLGILGLFLPNRPRLLAAVGTGISLVLLVGVFGVAIAGAALNSANADAETNDQQAVDG